MTDSSAKYHAIPSSEDQAYDPNVDEAGVGGDERAYSPGERIPAESSIKWTYFLLGCAIMLPWEGDVSRQTTCPVCAHVYSVLANATPFFLSRMAGSPVYSTFSSYSASVYTVTKLICQFYCTFTSKQVRRFNQMAIVSEHSHFGISQSSHSRRIFMSVIAMLVFATFLCLSTFNRGTPFAFFAFALFNAACMAAAASYLSTSVYAGASVLGTSFLQPVLTGQAAIAVAVSAVQVASSMIALWVSSPKIVLTDIMRADSRDSQAEEIAARIIFGIGAIFLCITLVAYLWLTRQPFYKLVASTLEQYRKFGDPDELTVLVTDHRRNASTVTTSHVYQVFRKNSIFMFSLAYVFIVSLVSARFVALIALQLTGSLTSRSILQ